METFKEIKLTKFIKSEGDLSRVRKFIDKPVEWYTCIARRIGEFFTLEEAEKALADEPFDENVVGYIIEGPEYGHKWQHRKIDFLAEGIDEDEDDRYDESPEFAITYNADKTVNAKYTFGDHNPNGTRDLTERCQFKTGDVVWVLDPGTELYGLSAMYPAVVVKTLDEEYIRGHFEKWFDEYIERNLDTNPNPSAEFKTRKIQSRIDDLLDIEWDSIVVRPLVLIRPMDSDFGNEEEEYIPRNMIYPYETI